MEQNQYQSNSDQYQGFNHQLDSESQMQNIPKNFEQNVRNGFVSKVFAILCFQLGFTVLISLLSITSQSFLKFQLQNQWLLYLCLIGSIVVILIPCCYPDALRQVPTNYIILSVFTFCEAYLVSISCGLANPRLVVMAALMTLAITLSLTLYACTTKSDITMMGSTLFILGMALLMVSLFAMFTNNNMVHILISGLTVVLYGFYLIYDIQLIMGGKTHEISMDDYIFAAIMLYLDIIVIFLELLKLLQRLNSSD